MDDDQQAEPFLTAWQRSLQRVAFWMVRLNRTREPSRLEVRGRNPQPLGMVRYQTTCPASPLRGPRSRFIRPTRAQTTHSDRAGATEPTQRPATKGPRSLTRARIERPFA